ncbi:MAG: hypothetical protein DRP74_04990 [Candidatus Omnitrophota bacterium]|nr:MAG: hypothetical protein DRP74_04990 [Candidatus Omnitrophota bacterium]
MSLPGDSIGYLGAFFAGVLVSFSPCTYPLIPITLSFIGVKGGASLKKGFILSSIYVLGISITYSILGFAAALTGKLFGQLANHPLSFLIIGNACIIAGLSFFDIINIDFSKLFTQKKIFKIKDYPSVFIFGLISGLAVGPCVAPALGVILLLVANKQNIIYGASLLFVFAYGVGFLLILVGTFSSLLLRLPKSGSWLGKLKKISGFVLIGMGEYFLIKAGSLIW